MTRTALRSLIVPLLLAAWVGSVSGTLLVGLAGTVADTSAGGLFEAVLGSLVLAHVVVLPLAVLALAIFGVPLAYGLRGQSRNPWLPVVALAAGGLVGRLLTWLLDMDRFSPALPGFLEYGSAVGALSGLCWLLFARDFFHSTTED